MITYPISFFGKTEATAGIKKSWLSQASGFEIGCAVPKEFEGAGGNFSPEDFFLMALQNCFVATFIVYSEYSKLTFDQIKVKAELVVDKDEHQKIMMKKLHLKIELQNVSDLKRAQLLINKTIENGFILQSVKTEIISEIVIS